jgi:hypothetical protein
MLRQAAGTFANVAAHLGTDGPEFQLDKSFCVAAISGRPARRGQHVPIRRREFTP